MNLPISRLVYVSKNCIKGDDATLHDAIENILENSRRANLSVGITGALMFNRGCFAQIIEGKRDQVEQTFERIQQDNRHSHVVVVSFEPVESRCFSSWSMGYIGEDQLTNELFDDIQYSSEFTDSRLSSEPIFSMLREKLIEAEFDASSAKRHRA